MSDRRYLDRARIFYDGRGNLSQDPRYEAVAKSGIRPTMHHISRNAPLSLAMRADVDSNQHR